MVRKAFWGAIARPTVFIFTDWWSGMSGGLSIPFAILGLTNAFSLRWLFVTLAFVALFILAGRLAFKCIPKLKIACGPNVNGCSVLAKWQPPARFWRLAVKTECLKSVTNCKGFLTRIDKDGENKWGDESQQLTFSQGEDPDALSKTVYNKVPAFLDVLVLTSNNEIIPGTKDRKWPYVASMRDIFSEPGQYILTVAVTGDGSPTINALLSFNWTGYWQTSQLTLIGI
jgi:hypothetical protein